MEKFVPPAPPQNPPPPTPKPQNVSIQDFILVGADPGKFYALGDDERIYAYNQQTKTWQLV